MNRSKVKSRIKSRKLSNKPKANETWDHGIILSRETRALALVYASVLSSQRVDKRLKVYSKVEKNKSIKTSTYDFGFNRLPTISISNSLNLSSRGKEEVYFSFVILNSSVVSRLTASQVAILQHWVCVDRTQSWYLYNAGFMGKSTIALLSMVNPEGISGVQDVSNGKVSGCFNQYCSGFVITNPQAGLDLPIVPVSVSNKTETTLKISISQSTGNWWLRDIYEIGYWPKEIFGSLDINGAEKAAWGSLVHSDTPISPPMGGGTFDNGRALQTAYMSLVQLRENGRNRYLVYMYEGVAEEKKTTLKKSCA
ncbi:hypothetical protein LguiB_016766 [Lonicera macranthoides]